MKRVLLTGAHGLLGRQLVPRLEKAGYQVVLLSRRPPSDSSRVEVQCDLLDDQSRQRALNSVRAERLIHLAWHDSPKDRWSSTLNHEWSRASLDLLRDFAKQGGKRAVFVGSCAEYDWSSGLLSETTKLAPKSVYGQAKAETSRRAAELARQCGVSLAWARVFYCYGPGEAPGRLLHDLFVGLTQRRETPCTDGLQKRDFLHTFDVADALAMILDSGLEGPVNVGSGEALLVGDIIRAAAALTGGADLLRWGAIQRSTGDPPLVVADTTRLRSLGFQPHFDLESGIRDCFEHFQASEESKP